jgi:hypothetical protein
LLGRSSPVLSLAHVMDLLAHELSGLRRGRLAFPLVFPGFPQSIPLRASCPSFREFPRERQCGCCSVWTATVMPA